MSCLRIRLPPANKAWKSFSSILQTRLHKLHKFKAIKKKSRNNNRLQKAASKTTRPSLLLGQRLRFKTKKRSRALPFGYYLSKNKAAAPVYIDKLFKDAPVTVGEVVGYIQQQPLEKKNGIGKKLIDEGAEAGTSDEGEKVDAEESVGLASPMLNGIDAKAEEFIASFRAEMERQEIRAHNL